MFSIIGGRNFQRGQQPVLLYFAFISRELKSSKKSSSYSTISQRHRFKLTTVVSGFAKPKNGKYIPASILHGKVGEDAYFKAHYVGENKPGKLSTYVLTYLLLIKSSKSNYSIVPNKTDGNLILFRKFFPPTLFSPNKQNKSSYIFLFFKRQISKKFLFVRNSRVKC